MTPSTSGFKWFGPSDLVLKAFTPVVYDPTITGNEKFRYMQPSDFGATAIFSGDIEMGAVEIKDAASDVRAAVVNYTPAGTEYGLVVRNIGTTAIAGGVTVADVVDNSNLPASGTTGTYITLATDPYGRLYTIPANLNHLNDSVATRSMGFAGDQGYLNFRSVTMNTTSGAQVVKSVSGSLYYLYAENNWTGDAWIKVCDNTGTIIDTTKIILSRKVPANGGAYEYIGPIPTQFINGIQIYATSSYLDNQTGALGTSLIVDARYA